MRDAVTDRQSLCRYSNVNQVFLNVISHLDNTSMPHDPFCRSNFDMHALVCKQNVVFNRLVRNTGRRSSQVIAGQFCAVMT